MTDIFISYNRDDAPRAEMFARAFESRGWSVWWDRTIPAGKTFDEVIEEHLDAAGCLVVLWSKRSVTSRWVRTEAGEGAKREILVPVLIEECKIPLAFRRIQTPDLSDWEGEVSDDGFQRLVGDIAEVIGRPGEPSAGEAVPTLPEPPETAPESPRRFPLPGPLMVWIAAAVVLAGLIFFLLRKPAADKTDGPEEGSPPAVAEEPDASGDELRDTADDAEETRSELTPTPAAPAQPRAGNLLRDCPTCPQLVVIPAGSFTMGSPPGEDGREETEGPQYEVTVDSFALGRLEVTKDEFEAAGLEPRMCRIFDGQWSDDTSKSWRNPGFEQTGAHPVVCVSWSDAQRFLEWLSGETGKTYRLPSEAEWEYAARAGTTTARFWGERPEQACGFANLADRTVRERYGWPQAHECTDGFVHTSPVESFKSNNFGLHDVLGNVYEWVEDCWADNYRGAPSDGSPRLDGDCSVRTVRGGSWVNQPRWGRSAHRFGFIAGTRGSGIGFRVARDLR